MSRSTAIAGTALACLLFIFLATTDLFYAPGATALGRFTHGWFHAVFGEDAGPRFGMRVILRKLYSVVAFSVVGVLVAVAAGGPKRRRYTIAIVAVALFSTIIEILQKFAADSEESLGSNAFDVFCGALGGAIGAFVTTFRRRG